MMFAVFLMSILMSTLSVYSLKDEKYDIYALEKGIIVHEKVDVKPDEGTIEISMPAHNNLDKMNLISDFKQGLTMRFMPDSNVCYLSILDKNQFPEPEILAKYIEVSKAINPTEELWVGTPNITYSYLIRPGTVKDRDVLSVAMQKLCEGAPIHIIEKSTEEPQDVEVMENGLELLPSPSQNLDNSRRRKRQTFCAPDQEKSACLLQNKFCHYVTTCELKYDKETRAEFEDCGKKHEFGKARCCRLCCVDASGASEEVPYCRNLKNSDMFKYCQIK